MPDATNLEGLTSLAVLKVNWDERQKDYLDNFIPFVKEALRRSEVDEISSKELQKSLQNLVGFKIPQGVVRILLRRIEGDGVRRISKTYYRDLDALSGERLQVKAEGFQRKTAGLVRKLKKYANRNWDVTWTERQTEELLLNYVSQVAAPLLHASRFGSEPPETSRAVEHADYIISAFVKRCLEQDQEGFEYLETIAKGCMMANVVYYEDPNIAIQKFDGVTFYLDTPFLLDALGINGVDLEGARKEVINLLHEVGAQLRVFEDTVDEMRGVIDAEARRPDKERKRRIPTSGNPIQSTLSSSDLRILSGALVERLKEMRVRVEKKPDFEKWLSLNEGDLEDRLIEAGYSKDKPDTIRHDVEALMAIHRLRRGRAPARLENCAAAFVTTNPTLVRVGKEFFVDQVGKSMRSTPPSVMHDELTARVWLKLPNEAPDLPRKQLLAHSYAALLPEDDVLDKYLQKIEEMKEQGQIETEDYIYLRSLKDVGRVVADVTLNDDEVFTEGTVEEIRERKEAEVQARAIEAEKQADREQERRRREEEKRIKHEKRAQEAERRAERKGKEVEEQSKNIRSFARLVRTGVDWGIRLVLFGLLAGGVIFALPKVPPQSGSDWWKVIATFFVGVAAIYGLWDAFTQAGSWSKRAGRHVENEILNYFLASWEPENQENWTVRR